MADRPTYSTRISFKVGAAVAPPAPVAPADLVKAALAAHQAGRLPDAERLYREVLLKTPDDTLVLANLGLIAAQRGQADEAIRLIGRSLEIRPEQPVALSNLGNLLVTKRLYGEAVAALQKAVRLAPDNPDAFNNLGMALAELNRGEEAQAAFERALALRPDFPTAQLNLGNLHRNHGRVDAAMAAYDEILRRHPNEPTAWWERASLLILTGRYREGWKLSEWRWRRPEFEKSPNAAGRPLWLGEQPVEGRTVLLHAEQGFGDTIQMLRYVPLLAERGAKVALVVQPPLVELARTAGGAEVVLPRGSPLPAYDLFCPLMSLPGAFGTEVDTVPGRTPYLEVPAPSQAAWDGRLGPRRRPRVGLAWAGSKTNLLDQRRSVALADLKPLFGLPADFVSLQTEFRDGDRELMAEAGMRDLSGDLQSFGDTAAVIGQLDLVIAVDTAVAHLAGALAKPAWILLPFMPDYRWGVGSPTTPWYPTARLFRQPGPGDWPGALAALQDALTRHLAEA